MPGKIFINYRRDDDPSYTQALYQRLEDEFASAELFMDVEGRINPGDDFVEVLSTQVGACDVMLAIIGPRWTALLAGRLNDPADFVALELRTAFAMDKRVIPVLVGGASMPRADELPDPIQPLARRNAVGLRPECFEADCQGLVTALKEQLADAEKERATRTEAERTAAEADRLKREGDEAARIAATEERARAHSVAGMSSEEVRKAEELANWDFIKERDQPQELRDHLARFPSGVTTRYARARLEELVWDGISFAPTAPTVEALQEFLNEFPDGKNTEEARTLIARLELQAAAAKIADEHRIQETEAWARVAGSTERGPIEAFLSEWPGSHYANAARARIAELKWTPLRHAMLLGAGVIVGFLLGAVTVGWRLNILPWGVMAEHEVAAVSGDKGGDFKKVKVQVHPVPVPVPVQKRVERVPQILMRRAPDRQSTETESLTASDARMAEARRVEDAKMAEARRIAEILAQATRRINSGDVIGARDMLAGAEDGAQGPIAFALAETYDPNMLGAWGSRGVTSDVVRARILYRKALELGVTKANMRLEALK